MFGVGFSFENLFVYTWVNKIKIVVEDIAGTVLARSINAGFYRFLVVAKEK